MKKHYLLKTLLLAASVAAASGASAQLSQNPDKFLGNITTRGQVNYNGIEFATLWDQLTPENESKWSSIEGTRGNFNFGGCDACYNYCKKNNIPFKFHTLIWGAQYPTWMDNLNERTQLREIEKWMDAVKAKYPDLPLIDVVNEAVPGHQPAPYKNCLGGDGYTGYDWIIRAFEMAHERWPEAILIYNDFNTFQWQKTEFINLVKTLRDAGAPIDAYGCQSHDLTDISFSSFKSAMDEIQSALKMPMYSTEYDIGTSDDQKQLRQYRDQIPYMWEKDYVGGITLWGFQYGCTWTTDGNSGIIRNGEDRPAMTWLREYMASDAAKTAKGPFPGGKKQASIYVRPESYYVEVKKPAKITVDVEMHNGKEVDYVKIFAKGKCIATVTEAPYEAEYTPTLAGYARLRADVYDTEGNKYTREGGVNVHNPRTPYSGEPITIPGVIEAEHFDIGGEGITYHDVDTKDEGGTGYRTDGTGVDIVATSDGSHVVGYTSAGEWLEYSINVVEEGDFRYEITLSAPSEGALLSLMLRDGSTLSSITKSDIKVPSTGDWNTYTKLDGKIHNGLPKGEQTLRLVIKNAGVNIDKIRIYNTSSGIEDALDDAGSDYDVYTTTGIFVGHLQVNPNEGLSEQLYDFTGNSGVYVLRNTDNNKSRLVRAAR